MTFWSRSVFSRERRSSWASWLGSSVGSLVLHALALFLLVFASASQRVGTVGATRRTGEVGIVLSQSNLSTRNEKTRSSDDKIETSQVEESVSELTNEQSSLQSVSEALLPNAEIGVSNDSRGYADALSSFSHNGNDGSGSSGQSVGFSDVRGKGKKFVYVLDRSDSMGWQGGAPMRRAIADAISSVDSLDPKLGATRFQIVAYNHDAEIFDNGTSLISTTRPNKARAIRYLKSLVAAGSTNPERALELGIKMRPDVVFFLTDADEELTSGTLARIKSLREQYKVSQICVVVKSKKANFSSFGERK